MTIGFIIPLKSKAVSFNWELEMALLKRTLESICGQTCQDFEVYVVYNDMPELEPVSNRVKYVHFPYETLCFEQIVDYEEYGKTYYNPAFAVKIMDKIRKVAYGCELAKKAGCKYLMVVDSDDLISNKIVAYIKQFENQPVPGWYIDKGYIFREGSSLLIRQSKNMQMLNGSTHIVRHDFFKVPNFNNYAMFDYSFFESHGYLVSKIRDLYGEQLQRLPFYGVVYVVHRNNWSAIGLQINNSSLKKLLKKIIYFQWLSVALAREFGIYHFQKRY
jgi:hypothetical protein